MNNGSKIERVTVETTEAGGSLLEAGSYLVEMPADYDAGAVTGEDVLLDSALRIVDSEPEA